MTGRDELEAALRANASMATPEPDPTFVDALEQRLTIADRSNVVPIARRARRLGATAVVTATVVFAGAAAAAGVVITHPFRHDAPVEVSTTGSTTTSTTTSPSTTLASAPVVIDTTVPVVVPTSTIAPTSSVAPSTTSRVAVPTTVTPTTATPITTPRTTTPAPTTTAAAASTTEVKVPATITLSCAAAGSTVHCSWSGAPAGMDHYAVLRSQPNTGNGRVYFVAAGTSTWTDPIATTGTTATYLVHAFDAANVSLGHSNAVSVPCC